MSSTYSPTNGFEKIGIGEQDSTWGGTENNNWDLVDQAISGYVGINIGTSSSYNLVTNDGALSNGRCPVVYIAGSPGSTVAINILPTNTSKTIYIKNGTGQQLNVNNGSGTICPIPADSVALVYCDSAGDAANLLDHLSIPQLNVTTQAALPDANNVFINAVALSALLTANNITSLAPYSVTGGNWLVAVFGTTAGTRTAIAFGFGNTSNALIPLPATGGPSFNTSQFIGQVSVSAGSGSGATTLSGTSITYASGVTAVGWSAIAWITGY